MKNKSILLLKLSKRTVCKILVRANCKCSLCNWNDASCDVHHIIPKSEGGTDEMNNLICVCPNCHRKLHQHKEKYKTINELKIKSLEITLPNWTDYYNPSPCISAKICKSNGIDYYEKECEICKKKIPNHLKFCSEECKYKNRKKFEITKEELEKLIKEIPFTKIGEIYNVTDNAIRKRCKKLKIEIPKYPRGYWNKNNITPTVQK